MTWRYRILRDLETTGMKGYLPKCIEQFLSNRTFTVRVQGYETQAFEQTNDVPQGSVFSVTLFAIKINGIAQHIPQDHRFIASLYVDDFQIGYRHSDLKVIEKNYSTA